MDAIVKMLEKHQPFFEKISRNIYLQAIKDGFLGCMPIVLTSSIFLLIATLPGVVGITLPQPLIDWCNKLYNFTMGVMGIMVAGTTAKNFTASMNRRMPAGKVLNDGSTMVAAQCSMLLLAVTQFTTKLDGSELSVFDCTSMGTRGLFSAYIAAFITVWVYKFCVSRDLTIKLPKEVPGAIAQNFRDIIPFGGAVIICGIIDVVVRNLMGVPFSELLIKLLSPLFTAAETYPGLILIQAATAFFWFIGVHGPSIVQPGIDPIRLANQAENLQVLLAGGHPAHSLTFNMSLVGEFGGTGATFIVPLLLILFMKSKQLKAVGKASIVPVAFAVNEPLLFGAPMILNPYMLIPFVAAGCVNVSVAKFFIDNVGMNGFSFVVPWATPAPIGIFITTNFQLIALVFVAIIILLDAIIYLPFLKAYDKLLCDQEAERAAERGNRRGGNNDRRGGRRNDRNASDNNSERNASESRPHSHRTNASNNVAAGMDFPNPEKQGKGMFVLCRTSNGGAKDFEYEKLADGRHVYDLVGDKLNALGKDYMGEHGYSSIGLVIGGTHIEEATEIRAKYRDSFFLIPGYGAQGGKAEDIAQYLTKGNGGVVNSSRGILLAYKKQPGTAFDEAAYNECVNMKEAIAHACSLL